MLRTLFCVIFTSSLFALIPERVLICGVCKNVATPLPYTIRIMEQIGSMFEDHRIIVYENNSTDGTAQILKKWANNNNKVRLKSENVENDQLDQCIINIKQNGDFFHPETIARARNIVLDIAMSPQYQGFPYIIWMDMDFTTCPAFEGITEIFQTNQEWDAVLAYGIASSGEHWDWYAFRDFNQPLGPELLGHDWFVPKYLSLPKDAAWYPVYSAFGGCGIYKKSSIIGCHYSGIVTTDLEKAMKKIIQQNLQNTDVRAYQAKNALLHSLITIDRPTPHLPHITDPNIGVILQQKNPDPLIWRMNSFTYQYPSVCEHVPFHASMIVRGHDKLFINPRLIFTY